MTSASLDTNSMDKKTAAAHDRGSPVIPTATVKDTDKPISIFRRQYFISYQQLLSNQMWHFNIEIQF